MGVEMRMFLLWLADMGVEWVWLVCIYIYIYIYGIGIWDMEIEHSNGYRSEYGLWDMGIRYGNIIWDRKSGWIWELLCELDM